MAAGFSRKRIGEKGKDLVHRCADGAAIMAAPSMGILFSCCENQYETVS
jgi:hypothetical protein